MSRALALLLALCALVLPSIARAHARGDVRVPGRASGAVEALARSRVGSPEFLQRDPEGYADSVNVYAAMANDPVNNRDPTGRKTRRTPLSADEKAALDSLFESPPMRFARSLFGVAASVVESIPTVAGALIGLPEQSEQLHEAMSGPRGLGYRVVDTLETNARVASNHSLLTDGLMRMSAGDIADVMGTSTAEAMMLVAPLEGVGARVGRVRPMSLEARVNDFVAKKAKKQLQVVNAGHPLTEATSASRLGIILDDISIQGQVASVQIQYLRSLNPADVVTLKNYLRERGVRKVVINSGTIINGDLAASIRRFSENGRSMMGGKVRKAGKSYEVEFDLGGS